MPQLRHDLIDEILHAQYAVFKVTSAASVPVWIELDLTMSQMKALRTLAFQGAATVSQVAATMRLSQPTASQLVDRLVQAGLAERAEDPADRRRTFVRLNKKGQQLHERLRGLFRKQIRTWLQRMNTSDLEALHRGYLALARVASVRNADGVSGRKRAGSHRAPSADRSLAASTRADGRG
jgi:DNA-binding MarR family transcriptional regulator